MDLLEISKTEKAHGGYGCSMVSLEQMPRLGETGEGCSEQHTVDVL